ncbi:MAG: Gx transporter family protein [Spirochaetia bacterium]|jgi:uncharacterized membrane protein|nr:Gx transporter family protein [Spirochaetia bacterium]
MLLASKAFPSSRELINQTAFLGALCLFFATLEYLFPRPVPFFRLGLANLPILLSIKILPFPYLILLSLLKVIGQGLINGTLASYVVLFSFSGTFLSLMAMYAARKIPGLSYIGISIIGAIFSNAAQVTLSILIVFGANARFIIPYFFTLGLLSGTAMGIFANWFSTHSQWYKALRNNLPFKTHEDEGLVNKNTVRRRSKDYIADFIQPQWRFFLGLLLFIPLFFQEILLLKLFHVITIGILCKLSGKRILYFYFINLIFWITLFQLLSPYGQVLLDLKILTITRGALELGLSKALLLIGLVFTSLFSVSPGLQLPGRLGGILAKMFYYYEELYSGKGKIKRASFINDIDNLLGETQNTAERIQHSDEKKSENTNKPSALGTHRNKKYRNDKSKAIFFSGVIILFFYSLLFLGII